MPEQCIRSRHNTYDAFIIVYCVVLNLYDCAGWIYVVVGFVFLQVMAVYLQEKLGAAFFLPRGVSSSYAIVMSA